MNILKNGKNNKVNINDKLIVFEKKKKIELLSWINMLSWISLREIRVLDRTLFLQNRESGCQLKCALSYVLERDGTIPVPKIG